MLELTAATGFETKQMCKINSSTGGNQIFYFFTALAWDSLTVFMILVTIRYGSALEDGRRSSK